MKKIEVRIQVKTEDYKVIDTLFKSLNPDNVNIPENISLKFFIEKDELVFSVSTENDIETLISTLREGLEYIGLSLQVMMVKENEKNTNRN
ncbi:MAG: KEOPS complex subunit Pcc1 [Nitrososphaeria archaeon]|nr:KEOPS complex subunit Pcc1 [Nitrososphaeria archaeon]